MNREEAIANLAQLVRDEPNVTRKLSLLDSTEALARHLGMETEAALASAAAANLRLAGDHVDELFEVAGGKA